MTFPLPALGFSSSPLSKTWVTVCPYRSWTLYVSLFEASVGPKVVVLAFLLDCKSTVTPLHHRKLTTNLWLLLRDKKKERERKRDRNTPLSKNKKFVLTHAFGYNYTPQDIHRQTFPELYRWDLFGGFTSLGLNGWGVCEGDFQTLVSQAERDGTVKHNRLSTQLKRHV